MGDNPLLAVDDLELFDIIRGRLDEEDEWLLEELTRRYIVALFKQLQAERSLEEASFFARLGAQS